MYLVFYKTNDVFVVEDLYQKNEIPCEVVPTPVQDKAYCGICLKVSINDLKAATNIISEFEYKIVK